ncbi:hypothetical protein HMPREF2872_00525 [Neisseria sp. HMSC069H12]|nr:hypothetical protein HMPREF2872_00525 [Neisseria sp. HMSC069H12]
MKKMIWRRNRDVDCFKTLCALFVIFEDAHNKRFWGCWRFWIDCIKDDAHKKAPLLKGLYLC